MRYEQSCRCFQAAQASGLTHGTSVVAHASVGQKCHRLNQTFSSLRPVDLLQQQKCRSSRFHCMWCAMPLMCGVHFWSCGPAAPLHPAGALCVDLGSRLQAGLQGPADPAGKALCGEACIRFLPAYATLSLKCFACDTRVGQSTGNWAGCTVALNRQGWAADVCPMLLANSGPPALCDSRSAVPET
jgi:hypothetical protein